jgi:hypothetical protein
MSYEPYCAICEQPVNLEESKTDEHGHAVHENCYVWTVELGVFPCHQNNSEANLKNCCSAGN